MKVAAGVSVLMDVEEETPWTLLATEWTLTFPPGESPALDIVQRIRREFFPEYVPLWCRKIYRDPGGHEVVAGWHVIGEWAPTHDDPWKDPVAVQLPPAPTELYPFQGGVVFELRSLVNTWEPGSRGSRLCAPPDALPYDMRVFHWMQEVDRHITREFGTFKQKVMGQMDRQQERQDKDVAHVEEEARLSLHDDRHMIRRAINEGNIFEAPKEHAPFVGGPSTVFKGPKEVPKP